MSLNRSTRFLLLIPLQAPEERWINTWVASDAEKWAHFSPTFQDPGAGSSGHRQLEELPWGPLFTSMFRFRLFHCQVFKGVTANCGSWIFLTQSQLKLLSHLFQDSFSYQFYPSFLHVFSFSFGSLHWLELQQPAVICGWHEHVWGKWRGTFVWRGNKGEQSHGPYRHVETQ